MRLWIRRVLLLAVALGVVGIVVYAFLPKPVPVDLAPVTRGLLRVTVDEDGKTRVRNRYELFSPLTGQMERIDLKPGATVQKGDTLAVLYPTEPALLDARALAEAEARVREAEEVTKEAEEKLAEARLAQEYAHKELARARTARPAVSAQELENLELKVQAAAARLRAAEAARHMADFRLELAKAAFIRTRPRSPGDPDGNRLEVRSPIRGKVLRVSRESAGVVTAGQPLLEVGDPDDLEVVVDVLSADAVRIADGARAFLEHWGGRKPLLGRVRWTEPSAFLKISALGVEEQRVNVIIDLDEEKPRNLYDGYRVEARIVVWEQDNVLKVPDSALARRGDRWTVFVAQHGRAVSREVEVGESNGLERQVLSGLEEGELVVVHPSDKVKDGVAIVPR